MLRKFLSNIIRSASTNTESTTELGGQEERILILKEPIKKESKGGITMKHQIELKLPKFLDPMFDKFTPEEKKKFGNVALGVGTVLLGISVIYLTGYNRGMKKVVSSHGIYIVKGGE